MSEKIIQHLMCLKLRRPLPCMGLALSYLALELLPYYVKSFYFIAEYYS